MRALYSESLQLLVSRLEAMYPFKLLKCSAAGSPAFRGILITDPGQMIKHITSETSLTYSLWRASEGRYDCPGFVSPGRAEKPPDLEGHLKQHSGPPGTQDTQQVGT